MNIYSAICVDEGEIRRVWFEAADPDLAHEFCRRKQFGFDATVNAFPSPAPTGEPVPAAEAYDGNTARRLLGGISVATLYRWLDEGKVDRVPNTRRLLVTRESLERLTRRRAG